MKIVFAYPLDKAEEKRQVLFHFLLKKKSANKSFGKLNRITNAKNIVALVFVIQNRPHLCSSHVEGRDGKGAGGEGKAKTGKSAAGNL